METWNDFLKWLASSPIASFLRVLFALVLAQAVEQFSKTGAFDFSNWQNWIIVGLVAAVPTLLRWINPEDKAFGAR